MRIFKALMLPLLLIISLLGVDQLHAAGDMTRRPVALPDLVLGNDDSDYFMSQTEYQLETGQAYQLKIIASGQKEYAFQAPEFATSIYLRKVEAGGVEIKAVTLTELEFEEAGEAEIFFLPVKPGKYRFYAKGLEGKGMLGYFVVK
ncbi:copper-binding protein [Pseudomonas sp. o96-267]|uniref:copper-binding protein n=1 Tax=Pseudomonas sp. o96-267 TaxID=2479853 RepID=UPI000F79013A|nr:copper-binding protein [Pseudomonas sp. o96-267]RRV23009.1 copper-binding protein [Pseudomonas sp. o96-267]